MLKWFVCTQCLVRIDMKGICAYVSEICECDLWSKHYLMWVGSVHEIRETRYVKVHCYVGRKFSWCVKLWSFLTTGSEKTTKLSESSTSIENAFDGSAAGLIHPKDQGCFSRMSMNYRFLWSTRFGFIMLYLNKNWGTPLKNLMVNHHFLKMARISSMTKPMGSVPNRFISEWFDLTFSIFSIFSLGSTPSFSLIFKVC